MAELMRLSDAAADASVTIKWCFVDRDYAAVLHSLGLVQGAAVQVISTGFGSMILAVGKKRVALGSELAGRIMV